MGSRLTTNSLVPAKEWEQALGTLRSKCTHTVFPWRNRIFFHYNQILEKDLSLTEKSSLTNKFILKVLQGVAYLTLSQIAFQ